MPTFAFFSHCHLCNSLLGNVPQTCIKLLSLFPFVVLLLLVIQQVSPLQRTLICSGSWVKGCYAGKYEELLSTELFMYGQSQCWEDSKPVCATARSLSLPFSDHSSIISKRARRLPYLLVLIKYIWKLWDETDTHIWTTHKTLFYMVNEV